jgi:MFS family permease
MGLGIGVAVPAIRRIIILYDPEKIGENLGRLVAADVAGFAAGPAISAILVGPFGIPAPFLVVAVTTAAVLPFVLGVHVDEAERAPGGGLALDLLANRPFAGAVVMGCAFFLMIGTFDALWAVVLDDLNTSEWIANLGITLFALPLVLLASTGGRLSQRVGPFRVATVGLLLAAGFMALYGVVPSGGLMFAIAMVHAVTDGLSVTSTAVAVGLVVVPERQAGAQGVMSGFQTLTAGIAAPIAGAIYQYVGRGAAYGVTALTMVGLVALGSWLARSAWSLTGEELNEDVARL